MTVITVPARARARAYASAAVAVAYRSRASRPVPRTYRGLTNAHVPLEKHVVQEQRGSYQSGLGGVFHAGREVKTVQVSVCQQFPHGVLEGSWLLFGYPTLLGLGRLAGEYPVARATELNATAEEHGAVHHVRSFCEPTVRAPLLRRHDLKGGMERGLWSRRRKRRELDKKILR